MRRLHPRCIPAVILTVVAAVWAVAAGAGDFCCAVCGCHDRTNKVCHLVCETRKVQITCWGLQEEDFCVPGPSSRGDRHCETICESSLPCTERQFVWFDWAPSCTATVFTRKKLQKRIVTREVPSYKWVTEDLCPRCAGEVTTTTH